MGQTPASDWKRNLAALLLVVIAANFFNVEPLFLGAAAVDLGLVEREIGYIAAVEMGGLAIMGMTAPVWILRVQWRTMALLAIAALIIGNFLTIFANSYLMLLVIRGFTGLFGDGLCWVLGMAVLGEAHNPDRIFGINMIGVTVLTAAHFYGLPPLIEVWQLDVIALVLALEGLLIVPILFWFPKSPRKQISVSTGPAKLPRTVAVTGLLANLVWFIAIGGFWAFVVRIASNAGLAAQATGAVLSAAVLSGLLGAVAATWLADRAGRMWPFVLTLILQIGVMLVLTGSFDVNTFLLAMVCFNVVWVFGTAYITGLIATADSDGRAIVLIPVGIAAGASIGPAVAGELATAIGLQAVNYFAAGALVVTLIIYIPFALRVTRASSVTARPASHPAE